jgi:putative membrane protein
VTVVGWIFALIAAALHIVVFACEAFLIERPSVHEGVFGLPYMPAVRMWAFGVGFYNLFLGSGLIAGVIAWMSGNETVGRTLVIYICLFMVLSGIVLFIADRLGFGGSGGKSIVGALGQSLPPLVALVAALLLISR